MDSNRASGQRSLGFIITDFTPANIKFKKMDFSFHCFPKIHYFCGLIFAT